MLEDLISADLCLANVSAASDEEVLTNLAALFHQKGIVTPDFTKEIIKRERIYPTGLPCEGFQVALPHSDPEFVNRSAILVATLQEPVLFREMGNPKQTVPVKIVFMLAIKEQDKQVNVLGELIQKFVKVKTVLESVANAGDSAAIYRIIQLYAV